MFDSIQLNEFETEMCDRRVQNGNDRVKWNETVGEMTENVNHFAEDSMSKNYLVIKL